jgi:G3E family GTPase
LWDGPAGLDDMKNDTKSLDITLICGLRGSGKTTLARALSGGAVGDPVVADWAPGHDVDEVASSPEFALELAEHLCDLADNGMTGRVVIELNPAVDALEAVLVLEAVLTAREPSANVTVLREVVVTVTATDVRSHFFSEEMPDPADYETGEALSRQIEIATAVVISGGDRVSRRELSEVVALIQKLNPLARVQSSAPQFTLGALRRVSPDASPPSGQGMGWMLELAGRAGPARTLAGISTVVFRDPRPFHPGRLAEVVEHCLGPDTVGTILRSRGLTRLASRPDTVGGWASTGRVLALEATSMSSWHPDSPLGQELVFVGLNLRADALCRVLGAALLDGDELIAGPMEWATYTDHFPEWDTDHQH